MNVFTDSIVDYVRLLWLNKYVLQSTNKSEKLIIKEDYLKKNVGFVLTQF